MTSENYDIESMLKQFPEYAHGYTPEPRVGRYPRKLIALTVAGVAGLSIAGGISFSRSTSNKPNAVLAQTSPEINGANDSNFRSVAARIDALTQASNTNPGIQTKVTSNTVVHGVAGKETTIQTMVKPTTLKKLGVLAEQYTVSYFAPTFAAKSSGQIPVVADGGEATVSVDFTMANKQPTPGLTYQMTKADGTWVSSLDLGSGITVKTNEGPATLNPVTSGFSFAEQVITAISAGQSLESILPAIDDAVH
jgi:hypothetical protein